MLLLLLFLNLNMYIPEEGKINEENQNLVYT